MITWLCKIKENFAVSTILTYFHPPDPHSLGIAPFHSLHQQQHTAMAHTIGNTQASVVGNSLHVRDFGSLNYLIEHALSSFDPSVVTLAAGALPITVPTGVAELTFDVLAGFPSNKAIDILMFLSLPPNMRTAVSTITTAEALALTDVVHDQIQAKKNIASVFLVNYLLHGTPRQMEMKVPMVAKFLLDATGMRAEDFALSKISSLNSLGGFRSTKLVIHSIEIFDQASATLKSRMKKGFGGSRLFTIARAMKMKRPGMVSEHAQINFFLDEIHHSRVPYITFHPDHPRNPMKDKAQRTFIELAAAFQAAGGDIDELAAEAPNVFIGGVVARLKASKAIIAGDLPDMVELIFATNPIFSVKASMT